jgi:hypothetical protein
MKKILVATVIASTMVFVPQRSSAQELSFQAFYSSLSPYGEWITVGDYGMCWRPVGMPIGWRPYVDGHWIWTEYGWTWVSDYEWGWAPFHYGRWAFDAEYGWVWMPGYVWAPAWVEWRWGEGYVGWAPMPPGFHYRVDVVVGPDYNDFGVGMASWNFVRAEEIGRTRYGYVERQAVPRVIGRTRNVTEFRFTSNGVYNTGLPREQVERVARHRIETVNVVHTTDAGRARVEGNQFLVYSPAPLAPRVRNESQLVQRERSYQPRTFSSPNSPRPVAPPTRVRTQRSSRPAYNSNRPPRNESRPNIQPKPRENNKNRDRDSRPSDNRPGKQR